jgi:EAL domain-containing protein (putative c-di-GMP-specific phosphodiesterase class I)/GGDEF domain-containing protein
MLNLADALEAELKDQQTIANLTAEKNKIAFIEPGYFTLLINKKTKQADLTAILEQLQTTIKNAYQIKTLTLQLSANIGIAVSPEHFTHHNIDAIELLSCAEKAMQKANKTSQPNVFYHAEKQQKPLHLTMAADIANAIENDELEIYHQPQVDLKTLRVCGSECLIRWYYQGEGFVSPRQFIPIAEDIGVIPQLTRWVINKSLEQHLILIENGHKHHSLSINISAKDIIEPSFVEFVQSTLKRYDISPDKLVFEVSESTIITDNSIAISTIEALITLGITMSIDHFGSGYSSMAYISQLPCQELKVDRQFVENITLNPKNRIITETTVKMAKGLSLEVIAEGINSKLDETILRDLGCDIGQGYYYAKAMPLEHYLIWLEKQINGRLADDDFL